MLMGSSIILAGFGHTYASVFSAISSILFGSNPAFQQFADTPFMLLRTLIPGFNYYIRVTGMHDGFGEIHIMILLK